LNNFEVAITSAINLGNDTDTVAAVTGALAGSMLGIQAIPSRWTTYLNGTVDSPFDHQGKRRNTTLNFTYANLQTYARELLGLSDLPLTKMEPPAPVKMLDDDGVYASNLPGMTGADSDMAVLSLCRTAGLLSNFKVRREVFLIDNVWDNLALDVAVNDCVETINAWLAEGRRVVVHCHAGRSRTGFILKAWYMNKTGCSHAEAHEWLENRWSLYDPNGNDLFTRFLDNY
jgi:ADP-ribosyl-[dinitrogen reductase] hydrolase